MRLAPLLAGISVGILTGLAVAVAMSTGTGGARPQTAAVATGQATGVAPAHMGSSAPEGPTPPHVAATAPPSSVAAAQTTSPAPALSPASGETVRSFAGWRDVAALIAPVQLPSDCPLPLDEPASLPGSERSYRGGVHQGIDFICAERGRTAVAALAGRVVIANSSYVEPDPADRDVLLAQAQTLGRTPPWTLALLFGRFVVLDHGIVPGVGHVVSIYAHLEQPDPSLRPGMAVAAGARIGEIGNTGTFTGATGGDRLRSLHLHWEIHVDDVYVGAGLGPQEAAEVYRILFGTS